MTIRRRLTLWYALLLTLIIIIFGTITFGIVRYMMIDNIDHTLYDTGGTIYNSMPIGNASPSDEIALPDLDGFFAPDIFIQAWGITADGQPVLHNHSANIQDFLNPLDSGALDTSQTTLSNSKFQNRDVRVLTYPLINDNGELVGYLQIGDDLHHVNAAIRTLLIVMVVSTGFAILGAGILSMWFSHRALEPIEGITQAAASIADTDDLRTRLEWAGPQDELGRLISVFNQMMDRIEGLFRVQQRFVADVSHELRTPLTSIQGNLELARRYGMDEESMEAMESETNRMARLVNELLLLARVDFGGVTIELYPIDLDSVLMAAYEQARKLARDRGLDIQIQQITPTRVNGNVDRLIQLLTNLLGNAIKFTADGGSINLGLEQRGGYAYLWVQDTGTGISADDLPHVFDRFFQSDPARAHEGRGFGLGLSISEWIVKAHNGRIDVTSTPGEGSTFTIKLPLYVTPQPTHASQNITQIRRPVIRLETGNGSTEPAQREPKESDTIQ